MRSMFESETGFRSLICNYNLELACTDGWGKNTDFLTPIPIIYQQISSCSIHSLIWKQHLLFHSLRQRFYSEYSNPLIRPTDIRPCGQYSGGPNRDIVQLLSCSDIRPSHLHGQFSLDNTVGLISGIHWLHSAHALSHINSCEWNWNT